VPTELADWSLILLCFSMAAAVGGGLYEHIVLTPLWSKAPPSSFAIIQPRTDVPLQRFWIPVHAAISVFPHIARIGLERWARSRSTPGGPWVLYRDARVEWPVFHS
jgi:hypothetical protein